MLITELFFVYKSFPGFKIFTYGFFTTVPGWRVANIMCQTGAGYDGTEIIHLVAQFHKRRIFFQQFLTHDPSQGTDPEKEAYVTIAPDSVTLVIGSTGGGTVTGPGEGSFVYEWDERVDLVAVPANRYRFWRWDGDIEAVEDRWSQVTTIGANGDFTITAVFRAIPRPKIPSIAKEPDY